jgi:itaconate CoA-transferase
VLQQPELLQDPRFASNALRVENRVALDATISLLLGSLTTDAVIARLESAQIANARMNTVQEFVGHEQLEARNRWRTIASPAGPLRALLPPFNLDGVDAAMGAVPAIGEHTTSILNELGFDQALVSAWRQAGVI